MMVRSASSVIPFLLLVFLGTTACEKRGLEPQMTPAAEHSTYAAEYPERLSTATQELQQQFDATNTIVAEFENMPNQLKDPDWKGVDRVIELSDADGQSAHYETQLEENMAVARFYAEEKDELKKKVGGAAQYQAKEKGCDADVYSAAAHAMDKAVEKQLAERTHSQSAAHQYIQQNQSALGKNNVETLELQADSVALASYMVHVGMVRRKNRIDALVEESSDVQKTMDRRLEELSQLPPSDKPEEQKAREEEAERLKQARAKLDATVKQGQALQQSAEERIEQARKNYQQAYEALRADVQKRAQAQPATTPAG